VLQGHGKDMTSEPLLIGDQLVTIDAKRPTQSMYMSFQKDGTFQMLEIYE
jgi:hypothetical protein